MASKVEVEITGKDTLSPALSKVEMGFAKLKTGAEGNAKGIRQLDNTFQDAMKSSLGLTGATGQLAGALIEFIPGGLVVGAVIGGIAMMVTHFNKLEEAQKKAQDANAELGIQLLKMQGNDVAAAQLGKLYAGEDLQKAKFALDELNEKAKITKFVFSSIVDAEAAGLIKVSQEAVRNAQIKYDIAQFALTQAKENKTKEAADAVKDATAARNKAKKDLEDAGRDARDAAKKAADEKHAATLFAWHQTNNAIAELERKAKGASTTRFMGLAGLGAAPAVVPPNSIKEKLGAIPVGLTADQQEKQKTMDKEQADRMANTSNLVYGIADAYQLLFATIGQGGAAYAQLGQAFSRMIGDMAKKKMMFELGEGISALFTPGMQASAAGHFKAAAIFGALAGLASAGGSAIGANNQGSRRDPNSNLGDPRGLEMGSVTINIVGGGLLDMNNPDTQRSFVKAIESIGNKRVVVSGGK